MKKTNVLKLLAGFFLIPAFFYLTSCEKETIEPNENETIIQSDLQVVEQENTGILIPSDEPMEDTDRPVFTNSSSTDKLAVAIKSTLCRDGKSRTLIAVKPKDSSFHFDEHKGYQLFWLKGEEKMLVAKNSKLHCVCGDKFTVVVRYKKNLKQVSATVKVPCLYNPEPPFPDEKDYDKF